jgi:uncharacterized protein (DUF1015 family)
MDIAPFAGLRYALDRLGSRAEDLCAPPYDVLRPEEHRDWLARSPYNITRLTLGDRPGETSSYGARGELLRKWIADGVLRADAPSYYVYEVEYSVPGGGPRARMLGLTVLGRLHAFEERIVLPHEETFPKVVDDRERLLEATHANLESIFLLYSDADGRIDRHLDAAIRGTPLVRVEAKPGEFHTIFALRSPEAIADVRVAMAAQRPMIADGHHRYTTSLRFSKRPDAAKLPGAGWQLMTLTNLHGPGLAILATHRLVRLRSGSADAALVELERRFERAESADWDFLVETRSGSHPFRVPAAVRARFAGVRRTNYSLLHELVIGEWLAAFGGAQCEIDYFKEGTGESDAIRSGRGDLLFRMRPVERDEFQSVVQGGEVFPHKTTYFYPKLWSGLLLWSLTDPVANVNSAR